MSVVAETNGIFGLPIAGKVCVTCGRLDNGLNISGQCGDCYSTTYSNAAPSKLKMDALNKLTIESITETFNKLQRDLAESALAPIYAPRPPAVSTTATPTDYSAMTIPTTGSLIPPTGGANKCVMCGVPVVSAYLCPNCQMNMQRVFNPSARRSDAYRDSILRILDEERRKREQTKPFAGPPVSAKPKVPAKPKQAPKKIEPESWEDPGRIITFDDE